MRPVKLRTVVRGYQPTKTGGQRGLVKAWLGADRPLHQVACRYNIRLLLCWATSSAQRRHKTFPCWRRSLADFLFERRLNDYIFQIVSEFSSGKPSLVFCSSRRGTSETAAALAKAAAQAAGGGRPSVFVRDPAQHARLVAAAAKLGDSHLRERVQLGVGYHHAAMEPEQRAAVEALFSAQDLPVRGGQQAATVCGD